MAEARAAAAAALATRDAAKSAADAERRAVGLHWHARDIFSAAAAEAHQQGACDTAALFCLWKHKYLPIMLHVIMQLCRCVLRHLVKYSCGGTSLWNLSTMAHRNVEKECTRYIF